MMDRPELIMAEELSLTPDQVEKFKHSKDVHKEVSEKIISEIFRMKNELMGMVFSDDKNKNLKADSLIAGIARRNAELEKITYNHFTELASYCRPDQLNRLKRFTMDMSEKWHRRNKPPLLIR